MNVVQALMVMPNIKNLVTVKPVYPMLATQTKTIAADPARKQQMGKHLTQ